MTKGRSILAILIMLMAIGTFAQEWELELDVYVHPDTTKLIVAKASIYGTDNFDEPVIVGSDTLSIDVSLPPPPPSGLYVFFPLDDPAYPFIDKLQVDARSSTDDTITWTIFWGGVSFTDSVIVEWDPSDLPGHGDMFVGKTTVGGDVDWASALDMSTISSIKANGLMEWIQIRFMPPDTSEPDDTPPYFTNWLPVDGSVDVPETTSLFCVDILDALSPIDETTIDITVFGTSIPGTFITTDSIAGGVRACVSTMGLISLPACSTITWIVSAEDTASNLGTDTSSFVTAGCGGTVFCIDGIVTLAGAANHAGTIVMFGAYHDTTTATGAYDICDVPEGTLMARVFHDGYEPESLEVILESDTTINFTLLPLSGDISGSVTLDGLSDHSGAIVSDWVSEICDTTDITGIYLLDDVPLGPVQIVVTYTGYSPAENPFTLHGDTTGVDFYLFAIADSHTVQGTVALEGATDYSGTQVIMSMVGFADTVATSATGAFTFDVEEGPWDFSASHINYVSYDTTFLVAGDLVLALELDTVDIPPVTSFYPPSNLQSTSRPCWPGAFNMVTWNPPMTGDTTLLAHCSGQGWGDTHYGSFSIYFGYGSIGGGYAMPFIAPEDSMLLTRVRLKIHPYSFGVSTEINVWEEDPDSGGPGAIIYSAVVALTDTLDMWAYIDLPDVAVGTEPFFVGWIDQHDSPDMVYCLYDYTSPDTLAWTHNVWDSSWGWNGDVVNMSDGDFAVECYLIGGSGSRARISPSSDDLRATRRSNPEKALAAVEHRFQPVSLEGPIIGLEDAAAPRTRPMDSPLSYRLYRSTSPFTDTSATGVEFLVELPDSAPYYLDDDDIDDIVYYYGMVADYDSGSSGVSNMAKGYNRNPPEGKKILFIDWSGGVLDRPSPGWDWDPSDSLYNMLLDFHDITADSIYLTREMERLYGFDFIDATDDPIWELVIISWNPYSAWGNWGPKPRGPEWRRLNEYLRAGGKLFIEGADAMQIFSGDGYTTNEYDSLYEAFGVQFYDGGRLDLDTGNVMTIEGSTPLFTPFTEDYSLGHISDFGIDEFEHIVGSGAFTVLHSQLAIPLPHFSNGRAVWYEHPGFGCTTYTQAIYFSGIIDIPVGTVADLFSDVMDSFGVHNGIEETETALPGEMALYANTPNPFNASTRLLFRIDKPADVELTIYDLLGNKVTTLVDEFAKPGTYSLVWDGADAAGKTVESGIYFYKLTTEAGSVTKRMILLK